MRTRALWVGLGLSSTAWASPTVLLVADADRSAEALADATEAGLNDVLPGASPVVGELSEPGWVLRDHAQAYAAGDTRWQAALDAERDVVVLLEHAETLGLDTKETTWVQARLAAAALDQAVRKQGGDTLVWVPPAPVSGLPDLSDRFSSFGTMQGHVVDGVDTLLDEVDRADRSLAALPVGNAFWHLHDQLVADGLDPLAEGSDFLALYAEDGVGLSEQGVAFAAGVAAAAMTGRAPVWDSTLSAETVDRFDEAVDDVIFAAPLSGLQLPFAWTWNRYVTSIADQVVSHPHRDLLVRVNWTATTDTVEVGTAHEVDGAMVAGVGRLELRDAARFTVSDRLVVGAGGSGTVSVAENGVLVTDTLDLAEGATLTVTGASIDARRMVIADTAALDLQSVALSGLAELEGDLVVASGSVTLGAGPAEWTGDVSIQGDLVWGGAELVVHGSLQVTGEIVTTQPLAGGTTLVVADGLSAAGLPVGVELVQLEDGRTALQTPSPTATVIDPESSGCQSVPGGVAMGWLGGLAGLGLLRRRRR